MIAVFFVTSNGYAQTPASLLLRAIWSQQRPGTFRRGAEWPEVLPTLTLPDLTAVRNAECAYSGKVCLEVKLTPDAWQHFSETKSQHQNSKYEIVVGGGYVESASVEISTPSDSVLILAAEKSKWDSSMAASINAGIERVRSSLDSGVAAVNDQNWEEAIKQFERAYDVESSAPVVLLDLGLAHSRAGHLTLALCYLKAYAVSIADSARARQANAEIVRLENEIETRRSALFQQAVSAANALPDDSERDLAILYLGLDMADAGHLDEAIHVEESKPPMNPPYIRDLVRVVFAHHYGFIEKDPYAAVQAISELETSATNRSDKLAKLIDDTWSLFAEEFERTPDEILAITKRDAAGLLKLMHADRTWIDWRYDPDSAGRWADLGKSYGKSDPSDLENALKSADSTVDAFGSFSSDDVVGRIRRIGAVSAEIGARQTEIKLLDHFIAEQAKESEVEQSRSNVPAQDKAAAVLKQRREGKPSVEERYRAAFGDD
jgi:hypothetical protein